MIVLHLTWLLNSLHLASSYRYLPKKELPTYSLSGGKTAYHKYRASIREIPFHLLIVYSNLYCSGSLIGSKIAITAASCLHMSKMRIPIVKVGVETITGYGQVIPIVDVKLHEYYRYKSRYDNDIAMLVLQEHVKFDFNVKKAILIEPEVALRTGVSIEVSGFGSTNIPQTYLNQLILSEMTVIEKRDCDRIYHNFSTPSNFCAKYAPDRRLSDSGGPAVYNQQLLVGILSYGGTTVADPHVALLTNVSYFHRWIVLNTKKFLEKYCVPKSSSSDDDDTEPNSDSAS